jgi:hypothetical protein
MGGGRLDPRNSFQARQTAMEARGFMNNICVHSCSFVVKFYD